MKYIDAIILGFVQGLTEFLPVSSSGHLMLLEKLGIGENSLLFNLMLHIATLLAVCIIYRKKLWSYVRHPFTKEVGFFVLATIPTIAIAFFVRIFMDDIGYKILPFGFVVTAAMLTLASMKWTIKREMDKSTSILTGIAQGIAALGGISRSGSTISVQLIMGIDREKAGDFTFILSIPIILGSTIVELFGFGGIGNIQIIPIILGMTTAFFSGIFAIKIFLKILKKGSLIPFAIYTFILGIVAFIVVYIV